MYPKHVHMMIKYNEILRKAVFSKPPPYDRPAITTTTSRYKMFFQQLYNSFVPNITTIPLFYKWNQSFRTTKTKSNCVKNVLFLSSSLCIYYYSHFTTNITLAMPVDWTHPLNCHVIGTFAAYSVRNVSTVY